MQRGYLFEALPAEGLRPSAVSLSGLDGSLLHRSPLIRQLFEEKE